jgi:hypothetical protein
MATEIFAKQYCEQMLPDRKIMIAVGEEAQEAFEVPEVEWPQRLPERAGTESLLYANIKIAGAEEVLRYGSDEAGIQRQGTYNQWCMIKHKGGSTEAVAMEAGGILVGATAEEVAPLVKSSRE